MVMPKSFKPNVHVPRGGEPCKHERHFRNLLRAVVHKMDWLAEKAEREYGDRFVYARPAYFQRACKDYDSGERWDISNCKRAVAMAFVLGVATKEAKPRMRGGSEVYGYTVAVHSAITVLEGKTCLWCAGAATKAQDAPQDAPQNAPQDAPEMGRFAEAKRPNEQNVTIADTQLTEGGPVGLQGQNAPLGYVKLLEVPVSALKGAGTATTKATATSNATSTAFPCDLTWQVADLNHADTETILEAFSDGEFRATALEQYGHTYELGSVLIRVVGENKAKAITDRHGCRKLMERVNDILRAEYKVNPPAGWIPVIKTLKGGGPLQHVPAAPAKPYVAPAAPTATDLWDSPFAFFKKELELYEQALGEICRGKIPGSFADAILPLEHLILRLHPHVPAEVIRVRNRTLLRIPPAYQRLQASA